MGKKLLVKNCGQILTMKGKAPKRGVKMSSPGIIHNGFVACEGGRIVEVGSMKKMKKSYEAGAKVVDAGGRVVMPGLIDCHTHLVFAGSRADEFTQKLVGAGYLDILKNGGGILNTVRSTRKASKAGLVELGMQRLDDFLKYGVTTVEIKTGYGLDQKTEIKMVEVCEELDKKHKVKVVPTFLGAHTTPPEFKSPRKYLDYLMQEVWPKVKGRVDFMDIFCEKGAFSLSQSKRYLKFAKKIGFNLKIHGEQLSRLGGCKFAAKLGAVSCDHCDHLSKSDVKALGKSDTVGVLLPLVPLFLRENKYADGRAMIDAGMAVAVSTDFNPGSAPSRNIFLAMNLACLKMGLTAEEVLCAVTVNAAAALNLSDEIGSLEKGKKADICIMNVKDYKEIPYWLGENLLWKVIQ